MSGINSSRLLASAPRSIQRREFALFAVFFLVALAGVYESTRRGASVLLVLAFLPAVAWLLTRSYGGLIAALALLLAVPYWYTLGSAQLSVVRAAALFALASAVISRGFRPRLVDGALVAFVAVVTLSWLFSYDQPHVGRIVTTEMTPIGVYVGARAIPRTRIVTVLVSTVVLGAIGALTVLYDEALGHVAFIDPSKYGSWAGGAGLIFRPGGIFGSPPAAATAMCAVILLGLSCLIVVRGRLRMLLSTCLVICAVALIVTFTRTGMIACGVGLLVLVSLWRPRLLRRPRVLWTLAVAVTALFVVLPTAKNSTTFQAGVVRGGTLTVRESFWQQALPIVTASPGKLLFGEGTGTLEAPLQSNQVQIPSAVTASPVITSISLQNEYVTTLFEQGLVGIAVLLLFLSSGLIPAIRAARRHRDPIHAGLAAVIVGIMVVMLTGTVLLDPVEFGLLLLAVALTANLGGTLCPVPERLGRARSPTNSSERSRRRTPTSLRRRAVGSSAQ